MLFDTQEQHTQAALFEQWLGEYITSKALTDTDFASSDIDAAYAEFLERDAGGSRERRGLTVRECWIRHQLLTCTRHVVMGASEHDTEFVGMPAVQSMPAITLLRWISRPAWYGARALGLYGNGGTALLLHVTVDDDGRVLLRRYRDSDPPVAEQLLRLGIGDIESVDDEIAEVSVDQADLASALVFAVVPPQDGLDTGFTLTPPPRPSIDDLPGDIYSSLFLGLADPRRGAPLEAVWHMVWETTGVVWCLLNEDREVDHVSRIPYRQSMPAEHFYNALAACTKAGLRGGALPVFVAFEETAGHCIYVNEVTDDHVDYTDPWPGRSLLATNNNTMDVAAKRLDESWKTWRITRAELERVGYASLVSAGAWCAVCDVQTTLGFADVKKSGLFSFFHLSEVRRLPIESGTRVEVKPGNWKESIDISFELSPADEVKQAHIVVDRAWLVGDATLPFAFDLVKSFITDTVSPIDSQEASWFVEAIWAVMHGRLEEKLSSGPAHLVNQVRAGVMAVMGGRPYGRVVLPRTTIRIRNDDPDPRSGRMWLSVSDPTGDGGSLFEDVTTGHQMDSYRLFYFAQLQHELERHRQAGADQS